MKNIFKFGVISALALASVFGISACSEFLKVESTGSLTEEQVFADLKNVEPLVAGLYRSYRSCKSDRAGLMPYLGTDETEQGNFQWKSEKQQSGLDSYNGLLDPTSAQVKQIWTSRWPVVVSASKAIFALGFTEGDETQIKQLIGEASFIRGMLMYELAMYWGEIPVIDMNRTEELGLGRQPLSLVWEYIINDFKVAAENLAPENADPQRARQGAAYAMLGRAYMSAPVESGHRDFAKADEALKKVIESNKYQLLANYEDLFAYDKPNSKESLFELQFSNLRAECNKWQFSIGSRACDSWFGNGCYFSGYDFLLPTKYACTTVAEGGLWEDGDTRNEASVRYDFTYYTNRLMPNPDEDPAKEGDEWITNTDKNNWYYVTPDLTKTSWTQTTDELAPHIKKYEDYRTDYATGLGLNNMWYSGKTYPMIRYADVLLLHAECLNELGKTSDAVKVINEQIRTRAWGGTLPADMKWSEGLSQDQFRVKYMDERMRELCFEGWRHIDLIRTDFFVEYVKERNQYAKASGTINANHKRYPIPEDEIKTNEYFTEADQNPGY